VLSLLSLLSHLPGRSSVEQDVRDGSEVRPAQFAARNLIDNWYELAAGADPAV
jgi:hypothetical protein